MRKIALERLLDESIHLAFCIFGNFLFSYNIYLSSAVCKYKELFFSANKQDYINLDACFDIGKLHDNDKTNHY